MASTIMTAGLFGIVVLVSFIWLVVVAFKRHLGWGFAVLLLSPIAAIIFAIMYWREAKYPFLIYIVAAGIQLSYAFKLFNEMGGGDIFQLAQQVGQGRLNKEQTATEFQRRFADRMLDNEQITQQQYEQLLEKLEQSGPPDNQQDEAVTEEMLQRIVSELPETHQKGRVRAKLAAPKAVTVEPIKKEPVAIFVGDISGHIGRTLIITLRNGLKREGVLTEIKGATIIIKRPYRGGHTTFKIYRGDIDTVYLRPD
ncbi:MAG TPA: DUF308 domain-containing protein [Acidiferrobacteraceae bacterium]|nr:DUF308 domain-containing protein [Acidiferrobacteraceae bacterium]